MRQVSCSRVVLPHFPKRSILFRISSWLLSPASVDCRFLGTRYPRVVFACLLESTPVEARGDMACDNACCSVVCRCALAVVIGFEVYDIYGDFETWYEYKQGRLVPNVDRHAERELLAFAIIGLLVSLAKIVSSFRNIVVRFAHSCCGRQKDKNEEMKWATYDLVCSFFLFIEVIPQSIIGWVALDTCPPKKWDIAWVDRSFAATCLIPYAWMAYSYAQYSKDYLGCQNLRHLAVHVLFVALLVVGVVFASLQIHQLRELDC